MLKKPSGKVGYMEELAEMPGTVGLVSRWEVMGQEAEKEGSTSGPSYVRPRMAKLVRYIIQ